MKRKRMRPRNRTAFRRVLIALAALFLVNHFLLTGLLFPIQAIRRCEERAGTGRTAVVRRDWAPEIYKTGLIYLTENETVTMLSGAHLTLYGWMDNFGVPVDCSEPAAVHGGWWAMSREGRGSLFYVFGRVDDPGIDLLTVQVRYEDWAGGESVLRDAFSWGLEREDLLEKDGRYYFLLKNDSVDFGEYTSNLRTTVTGVDLAGNVIAEVELDGGGSSSYG
nr:hypothetical protein [uncultured Oscillibacter sp.]